MHEKSKAQFAHFLRRVSYGSWLVSAATVGWDQFGRTKPVYEPLSNGDLKRAAVYVLGIAAVILVSVVANGLSLALAPGPISRGRKIEFCVFALPILLVIAAVLVLALRR